ncbi:MAG: DUF2062 domain-containing protein [Alphaproteobacteria bacterium]|nr:DUF2062 domain-containing protein [Alphaproteobacteria bacterium]
MGWRRAARYGMLRIVRLSDTTHKIALGLAFGTLISCTPLVGTHFIQAGFLAYIFRANIFAALMATFIGNPWTFPFMWWAAISFGSFLFTSIGLDAARSVPKDINFHIVWDIMMHEPLRIFLPWFVGSYLFLIILTPVFYFGYYHLVRGAKLARKKARTRKLHRAIKEITGQR